MQYRRFGFRWLCVALLGAVAASCQQSEGIQQYTVKKVETPESEIESPQGTQLAWFFKFSGPAKVLGARQLQEFGNLIRSIRLGGDKAPNFDLPKGWTEEKGTPPRYLTLKLPHTNPPLEVAVSALPAGDPNSREYLMVNMNRWREQLGLGPDTSSDWYEDAEAKGELARVTNGAQTISLIHLIGETKEYGPTRTLVAMITPGADVELMAEHRQSAAPTSNDSPGFTAEVPEGWESALTSQFAMGAYTAENDSGTVKVSVSLAGGGVLPNVNRWRGQVGLPPLSETDFAKNSSTQDVGGEHGTYVELFGPKEAILGVIVTHDGQQWFFKGMGPVGAVKQELLRFKEFIESVKFE